MQYVWLETVLKSSFDQKFTELENFYLLWIIDATVGLQ